MLEPGSIGKDVIINMKWKYGIIIWYLDDPARFWFADYNDDFCRYDENELAGKHIKTFFIKAYVPIGIFVYFVIFVAVICKQKLLRKPSGK